MMSFLKGRGLDGRHSSMSLSEPSSSGTSISELSSFTAEYIFYETHAWNHKKKVELVFVWLVVSQELLIRSLSSSLSLCCISLIVFSASCSGKKRTNTHSQQQRGLVREQKCIFAQTFLHLSNPLHWIWTCLRVSVHMLFFSDRKLLAEHSAVPGWSTGALREKECCTCVLSPRQQYLDKGRCMINTAPCFYYLFSVWNPFFVFLNHEWASNGGSFPSYLVWMMSLIMIRTRFHSCSEQTWITEDVDAWHEHTQTRFLLSGMIVFVGHFVRLWVHGDDQRRLLLRLWVLSWELQGWRSGWEVGARAPSSDKVLHSCSVIVTPQS